jgi:hypothetical protein
MKTQEIIETIKLMGSPLKRQLLTVALITRLLEEMGSGICASLPSPFFVSSVDSVLLTLKF